MKRKKGAPTPPRKKRSRLPPEENDDDDAAEIDDRATKSGPAVKKNKGPVTHNPNAIPESCSICDKAPAPDGSNWKEKVKNSRHQWVPLGDLCESCGAFLTASSQTEDEVLKQKEKKASREALEKDLKEFQEYRNSPGENRAFVIKKVTCETVATSSVVELLDIKTRQEVKDETGFFPEEHKLKQIEAKSYRGEIKGVIVESKESRPKLELRVTQTVRIEHQLLQPDEHVFESQANKVFEKQLELAAQYKGQASGDRYQCKKEGFGDLHGSDLQEDSAAEDVVRGSRVAYTSYSRSIHIS